VLFRSIYADSYEYYAPEKGSERHRSMLLYQLEQLLVSKSNASTDTYKYLHEIAEKLHRRSLIFLFTDMFQSTTHQEELFEALRHLKYNKHEVVLFHTFDSKTEFKFDFDNSPKKFVDIETGEEVNLFAENIQENYTKLVDSYFKELKNKCLQYKISYVPVDIQEGFHQVLARYFLSRQKMM
jgi:dTDP-4-dehydrorhamnose reductase